MNLESIQVNPSAVIGGETVPAVNLRDLHEALEVSTQYKDWSQRRIKDSMAVEDRDFLTLKFEHNLNGGRAPVGHLVTLDTAKHIAMLERNEKGRQIREYFIRIEKEFRSKPASTTSRIDYLRRELALLENGQLSSDVIENIRPIRAFGSPAKNGAPRLGLRRAAWVARRSRLEDALEIHRELRLLDQAELALGWEGGAA